MRDWDDVVRIYAEGIATRNATFETKTPTVNQLERTWLQGHRWVAVIDGAVVGWAAITPTSARQAYAGVGETSVYVDDGYRGRGVGKALIHRQVNAADDGRALDLADVDLPREPRQRRAAPLGRLPNPRHAREDRAARRRMARHRLLGAALGLLLSASPTHSR